MIVQHKLDVCLYTDTGLVRARRMLRTSHAKQWTVTVLRQKVRSRLCRVSRTRGQSRRRRARPTMRWLIARRTCRSGAQAKGFRRPFPTVLSRRDASQGEQGRSGSAYFRASATFLPQQIVTIGDMPNDVLMFSKAASVSPWGTPVRKFRSRPPSSPTRTEAEGFAKAMERVLQLASGK